MMGEKGRKIYPELIMGSKQEKILGYLDIEIMRLNHRGRMSLIIGTLLFAASVTYEMMWGRKSKK